jgi:3D (Asp-Asp-Asp) domain-containing protein
MKQRIKPHTGRSAWDKLWYAVCAAILISCVAALFAGNAAEAGSATAIAEEAAYKESLQAAEASKEVPLDAGITVTPPPTPTPTATPPPTPEPEMTYLGTYYVVGYNYTDGAQCGKAVGDGITASGDLAEHGKTAAMAGVPFGTRLYIEGYGEVTINDRGVTGRMIDIAFDNDADCYAVTGRYEVWVINNA